MSISGNLQTMELSELLQWVAQGSRTGTLVIETEETAKRIYFRDGKIVASGSTLESEQLGHFLVSRGYINDEELTKAVAMQSETGMLLGKILVTIGGISEEELLELLVLQTEESVYDLFAWTEADFRFVDNETLNRGMIPLALDVTAITLQGMNRLDEWSRIRKVISSSASVPVLVAESDLTSRSPADQRILEAIDDHSSIEEICRASRTSEFLVSRLLMQELQERRVKVIAPRTRTAPAPAPVPAQEVFSPDFEPSDGLTLKDIREVDTAQSTEPPLAAPIPSQPAVINGAALSDQGMSHLEDGNLEEALRHLRAALVLEPRNSKLKEALARGEDQIRQEIHSDGLNLDSVPILERNLEQLTDLQLSPEQGFLLTRIDGSLTIKSLLRLSPLDRLDAELVFYRLVQEGHVRLSTDG